MYIDGLISRAIKLSRKWWRSVAVKFFEKGNLQV